MARLSKYAGFIGFGGSGTLPADSGYWWHMALGLVNMRILTPNEITGPNAGGLRQLPIPRSLTARVGQFCRSA